MDKFRIKSPFFKCFFAKQRWRMVSLFTIIKTKFRQYIYKIDTIFRGMYSLTECFEVICSVLWKLKNSLITFCGRRHLCNIAKLSIRKSVSTSGYYNWQLLGFTDRKLCNNRHICGVSTSHFMIATESKKYWSKGKYSAYNEIVL